MFWALVLTTILLVVSCSQGPANSGFAARAKAKLDSVLPTIPIAELSPAIRAGFADVYLDGSISCRGFLRSGDSTSTEYVLFLGVLREMIAGEFDSVRFYKFGNVDTPVPVADCRDARVDKFYTEGKTKLGPLLKSVADRSAVAALTLILTDGVPSTKMQEDALNLVAPVSALMDRGLRFYLLAVRSRFSGTAYSEMLGDTTLGPYTGRRPFYCFLIARDRQYADKLVALLRVRGVECRILDFVPPYTQPSSLVFSAPSRGPDGERNKLVHYSQDKDVACYSWRPNTAIGSVGFANILLHVSCASPDAFALTGGDLRQSIALVDADVTDQTGTVCQLQSSGVEADSASGIRLVFRVEKAGYKYPLACKVVLFPGAITFSPPKWVTEWSADTDTSIAYYNRTLYLREFVSVVAEKRRPRFEPIAVFYVILQ